MSNSTVQLITALITLVIIVINHFQGKSIHKVVNSSSEKQVERIDGLTEKLVNEVVPAVKGEKRES